MKEITVQALPENLQPVLDFVSGELDALGCPMKKQMQIGMAVEEIFINIANYAYHPNTGEVLVRCDAGSDPLQVTVQFMDSGKPFNPLEKKDPDITLTAEERDIGGLGLYLVKKIIHKVTYEYLDGKNVLTIQEDLEWGSKNE